MYENDYFRKALGNMTTDLAYARSVRHLYDLGYSVTQIQKECSYPVSIQQVERVIQDYEKEKNSPEGEYCFIEERNLTGQKTFRRVKKNR